MVRALQAAGVALKGALSAAIAGGGITVAVVLVICLAGFLLVSPLGMFFSDEITTGPAIQDTIVQLNGAFANRIEQLKEENPYDVLDLDNAGVTAALSNWRDVLAVYAVRVTTDSVNPSDVLTLTAEKQAILRATFWDMSVVNFDTETVSGTDRLHITISTKNALQMADEYGFTADQRKLLEEMLSPAYQEFFQQLTGNFRNITLTAEQIQQIMENLPASLSTQRKQVILTAYQLLGKVNYFWGGKSLVLGWDSRWGTPREVTAAGSPSSGTIRPYGLDCSGFVDWVFYNVSNGGYVIGHGGGARMQHRHCTNISWSQAIPGDLVFYPEDTHVGIVCGFDESGNVLIIHCASGTLRTEAHPEASVLTQSNEIKVAIPKVIEATAEAGYLIDKMTIAGGSAGHTLAMIYAYRDGAEAPVLVVFTYGGVGPSSFYREDWGIRIPRRAAKPQQGCSA